jgi:hypothetical protein
MKRFIIGGPDWRSVADLVTAEKGIAVAFSRDFIKWVDDNSIDGDVTLRMEKINQDGSGMQLILTFEEDSDAILFRLTYPFEMVSFD